ncbi:hypothetical protein C8F01DRAFT_1121914, partial [Mycena amicta]
MQRKILVLALAIAVTSPFPLPFVLHISIDAYGLMLSPYPFSFHLTTVLWSFSPTSYFLLTSRSTDTAACSHSSTDLHILISSARLHPHSLLSSQ